MKRRSFLASIAGLFAAKAAAPLAPLAITPDPWRYWFNEPATAPEPQYRFLYRNDLTGCVTEDPTWAVQMGYHKIDVYRRGELYHTLVVNAPEMETGHPLS